MVGCYKPERVMGTRKTGVRRTAVLRRGFQQAPTDSLALPLKGATSNWGSSLGENRNCGRVGERGTQCLALPGTLKVGGYNH